MNHLIMWIQNSLKAVCKILKLWEERDCENIGYALLVHYCVCECPGRPSQLFFPKTSVWTRYLFHRWWSFTKSLPGGWTAGLWLLRRHLAYSMTPFVDTLLLTVLLWLNHHWLTKTFGDCGRNQEQRSLIPFHMWNEHKTSHTYYLSQGKHSKI